ncbi:MAG: hypothetical protein FWB90_05705 [Fibromonadales bacterium]|nr:hypothetical protein [Fibromonadales bacterium]
MNCFKRILPASILALFLSCAGDFKEITDEERQALASSSSDIGMSSSDSGSSSSEEQSSSSEEQSSSSEEQSSSSASEEASSSSVEPGISSSEQVSSASIEQSSSSEELSSSSASEEASSSSVEVSSGDSGSSSSEEQSSSSAEQSSSSSSDESVYLCDGEEYDPNMENCEGIKVVICKNGVYAANYFCYNGFGYEKCDGKTYDAEAQFCLGNGIKNKCGGKKYDAGQFCSGNGIIFGSCGGPSNFYNTESQLCDSRDNTIYPFVKIGDQTWMAENLNYATAGSKCVEASGASGTLIDNGGRCGTYGRLYNWATAMNLEQSCNSTHCATSQAKYRGVCPDGWHFPSNDEWTTLQNYVEEQEVSCSNCAGTKLKAASGWNGNGNGTDDFGFSALPGGYGADNNTFGGIGGNGRWWSSTQSNNNSSYLRHMNDNNNHANSFTNYKVNLFSVRCLLD